MIQVNQFDRLLCYILYPCLAKIYCFDRRAGHTLLKLEQVDIFQLDVLNFENDKPGAIHEQVLLLVSVSRIVFRIHTEATEPVEV